MKNKILILILCLHTSYILGNNKTLLNSIEKRKIEYSEIAKRIWEYAEVGYKEKKKF